MNRGRGVDEVAFATGQELEDCQKHQHDEEIGLNNEDL
jgi:hypothetical protein